MEMAHFITLKQKKPPFEGGLGWSVGDHKVIHNSTNYQTTK